MSSALALMIAMSSFHAVPVESNHDGDNVRVVLPDLPEVFTRMSVRVSGIDTPETDADRKCERRDAKKARALVSNIVTGQLVDLNFCQLEKYGRLLCAVKVGDVDLGNYMLESGYAVPYSGGTKMKWKCK